MPFTGAQKQAFENDELSNQNLSARKSASEDPKNETKFINSKDLAINDNLQGLKLEG